MKERKPTNLHHANSIKTTDNSYSKGKIIQGVKYGLKDYENYIEKSIEVIQKNGAIKIPIRKEEIRYYIKFNEFSNEEKIKKQFFDKINTVFINDKKQKTEIIDKNEKHSFIVLKTDRNVTTITLILNNNTISLKTIPATLFSLEIDNLKNRDAKKIETELFERSTEFVYSEQPKADKKSNKTNEIKIKTRDSINKQITLDTIDNLNFIYLKADDSQLIKQRNAIKRLRDKPSTHHTPIQKLFDLSDKAKHYFKDNIENYSNKIDFKILNKPDEYDGTKEQQKFVINALQTKDFALLEGPPGSGKTTAIVELIIQLIKQNKRVLLVSATHVAVDNVIHRILTSYKKECEGLVVPIRIASNIDSIRKETVEPYELKTFIKKTKKEISKNIRNKKTTDSGRTLLDSISQPSDYRNNDQNFDDIILKSANLVGGTMIGILQHPDIKKGGIQEVFDVMIVDESSKVTFLDFIVPALYAKKWILVGDVNQLSPYTEDDLISENVDIIIKDNDEKEKLITAFELNKKLAEQADWNKKIVKILFSTKHNENDFKDYVVFKLPKNFEPSDINILKLNSVDLIICEATENHKKIIEKYIYVKAQLFEGSIDSISFNNIQRKFHKNRKNNAKKNVYNYEFISNTTEQWKDTVGSKLSQMYQYRLDENSNSELKKEFNFLVPQEYQDEIEKLRRVAFPSILELLQIGTGEKQRETKDKKIYNEDKLIYKGFNQFEEIKYQKFQTLTYQHRMEDEIANLSRTHFYTKDDKTNLETAKTTKTRSKILNWYKPNEDLVIWVQNKKIATQKKKRTSKNKNNSDKIINLGEVEQIKEELNEFTKLAQSNPKEDNSNYEIAVLTFYRAQETELKKMLQDISQQKKKHKFFTINNVSITLSTVDKFQGDEADMVLLSFTKTSQYAHYNSPNRLNVALTRARYKLVLYGNNKWLSEKTQLQALKEIAKEVKNRVIR
ncbi:AAA domain-containing protein [Tenacibaculum finnmarkense genomovar ulcerans]|uniref:AAA domain-containing protein n=1 Tax=Tenacibaculum finnmarkense TaxID=2781243 RepID=UPI001E2827D8|nr:AAA domain-containing protein [Tenacibaculum finnmarkense]MCD8432343.1 AAA domain-containing protein [Tenacibaculum finnmarkense genomovar ulcerans]